MHQLAKRKSNEQQLQRKQVQRQGASVDGMVTAEDAGRGVIQCGHAGEKRQEGDRPCDVIVGAGDA